METRCYKEIKRRIQSGEYESGTRLIETTISRELEISRTPVRKAIAMLTADGFVENLDYRGAIVKSSKISKDNYIEILDIVGLFLKHTIERIEAKKIRFDQRILSPKRVEFEWQVRNGDETAYTTYCRTVVLELVNCLKNDYYHEILVSYFDKINQFADNEVLLILEHSGPELVNKLNDLISAIECENYLEAKMIVDETTEFQILSAYR
ncbi:MULTISPECIES: GntR family transcriptional regulator [Listeria]|nr:MULTISPECIES: GntR family transcriptional regulator [Listeria]